jgi:hypothetical protein
MCKDVLGACVKMFLVLKEVLVCKEVPSMLGSSWHVMKFLHVRKFPRSFLASGNFEFFLKVRHVLVLPESSVKKRVPVTKVHRLLFFTYKKLLRRK